MAAWLEGIHTTENMKRCICNNYDIEASPASTTKALLLPCASKPMGLLTKMVWRCSSGTWRAAAGACSHRSHL